MGAGELEGIKGRERSRAESLALADALGLSQKLFLPRSYSFQDLGF